MASELQDTLARIISKSNVLVEKYNALQQNNDALSDEVAQLKQDIEAMKVENEKLRQENEYLTIARSIAPDHEKAVAARSAISQIVRDIDKCIAQLNE